MHLMTGEPECGPWRAETLGRLLATLLEAAGPVENRPAVVAIDGRSSSGKTSLSERLAGEATRQGIAAQVVHSDDIAWHHAAFAWADAMVEGVLAPLRRGEAVRYRPPGWVAKGRTGAVEVPAGLGLLLVEGDGSSRRELTPWIDAAVYVQADEEVRRAREAARVAAGEMSPEDYASWVAEEEPFVLADRPWERATIVVCGTLEALAEPSAYDDLAVADPPPHAR